MPELPDLEVFSNNLNKKLHGQKVKEVQVPVAKKLNVPVKDLQDTLQGQSITKVYRDGKQLHIAFSKGDVLALHLMLHGSLELLDGDSPVKHKVLALLFDSGKGLALTDWQGAATPALNPEEPEAPDALSKKAGERYFKDQLKSRRNIKAILLDQKVVRGIGNAYADEILWDARISPLSVGSSIPEHAVKDLVHSVNKVLTHAEKEIKKSHPDIISGEVRGFLLIHNPKKKQSPSGADIQIKTTGGRKTYYTDEQVLYS